MKKYLGLSIATFLLIVLVALVPQMLDSAITGVEVVRPSKMAVNEDIYANGVIEELSKKDVYAELPIVPESVNFQIGDFVKPNDIIATVDTAATQAAIFEIANTSKLIPAEYLEVLGNISISEDMLRGYIPTQIVSPTSGVITEMNLLEGSITTPKTLVCTISKTDDMRVRLAVDEFSADKVAVGDTVVFRASATQDVRYTGKVSLVFPTATKTISGTAQMTAVSLYVELDEKYSRLKPGYTVNGVIKKGEKEKALTIPYEAVLQDENDTEYVYIYENAHAIRKNIKTGKEFSDMVEVIGGIDASDLIISNASAVKGDNSYVKIS